VRITLEEVTLRLACGRLKRLLALSLIKI